MFSLYIALIDAVLSHYGSLAEKDEKIVSFSAKMPPERRKAFLSGRALLSAALQAEGIICNNSVLPDLVYGATGRPYFKNLEADFSISHSGPFISVALSLNSIGSDLECIKDKKHSDRLLKRVFCEEELSFFKDLCTQNAAAAEAFFCRQWTLRESLVKLEGSSVFSSSKISFSLQNKTFCAQNPSRSFNGIYSVCGRLSDLHSFPACPDAFFAVSSGNDGLPALFTSDPESGTFIRQSGFIHNIFTGNRDDPSACVCEIVS